MCILYIYECFLVIDVENNINIHRFLYKRIKSSGTEMRLNSEYNKVFSSTIFLYIFTIIWWNHRRSHTGRAKYVAARHERQKVKTKNGRKPEFI